MNDSSRGFNRDNNRGKGLRTEIRLALTAMLSDDSTEIAGYDCVLLMTKDSSNAPMSAVVEGEAVKLTLHGNRPNPFNPTTRISFTLPNATHVRIDIFNLLGQKIETLVDKQMQAGKHAVVWNALHQASGVYFYRVQSDDFVETRRMILMK